jgi:hypothetical protein
MGAKFELSGDVNSVEVAWGHELIRLESGKTFSTDDPALAAWLEEHPDVKKVGGKKADD